jgi:dTDP-4-amino-4,6-dideoxygalactose transaminase
MGYSVGDCPVTEYVSERILRLPFYASLSIEEQQYVIDTMLTCF